MLRWAGISFDSVILIEPFESNISLAMNNFPADEPPTTMNSALPVVLDTGANARQRIGSGTRRRSICFPFQIPAVSRKISHRRTVLSSLDDISKALSAIAPSTIGSRVAATLFNSRRCPDNTKEGLTGRVGSTSTVIPTSKADAF